MQGTIIRHAYLPDVTLGRLYVGPLVLPTLEEPWIPNPYGPGGQSRDMGMKESCIPDGVYELHPHNGAKFRDVWYLKNEALGIYAPGQRPPGQKWGREAILIHSGNTVKDISGCILVGLRHGTLNGLPAVLDSRAALDKLRAVLGSGRHTITIRAVAGTEELAA